MLFIPRLRWSFFGPMLVLMLSACAAGSGTSVEWRLMVKVATPSANGAELIERATRTGGAPARYGAAIGPQWHGIVLRCGSDAACGEAVQRLKADSTYFLAVERDEQRRAHGAASAAS